MNDPTQRLRDIVRACADASELAARGRVAFDGDPLLVRAAKNMVTEIGEAAKGVGDLAEQLPTVPWKPLRGCVTERSIATPMSISTCSGTPSSTIFPGSPRP